MPDTNTFAAKDLSAVRRMMAARTVDDEFAFVLPLLQRLPPAFVLCDAGCGPGSITVSIARRFPDATVLGFDIDPVNVELAKELAQQENVANVKFVVGSALDFAAVADADPAFAPLRGGCDMVMEHVTLMHLAEPLTMLKQMRGAAKPGGWVACRDHDMELNMIWPPNEGVDAWNALVVDLVRAHGCSSRVGRQMLHFALQAGYAREQIQLKAGDFSFDSPRKRELWVSGILEGLEDPARCAAVSKLVGYEVHGPTIVKGWRDWLLQEDAWLSLFTMEMLCQK